MYLQNQQTANVKLFVKYYAFNFNAVYNYFIAGAIGNLIDRIVNGYVVDFLYFKLIDFPVFNVADCYVTIACALLIIFCVFVINDKEFNAIFSLKKDDSEDKKDK